MSFFFGDNSLYSLSDNRLLERNAVSQLQFTAMAFPPLSILLSDEISKPLHIERPAMERPIVIELDEDAEAERPPAASANFELLLEDYRPLLYRAEVSRLGSLHCSSLKNREPSLPRTTFWRRTKKAGRTFFDGEGVKIAARTVKKRERFTGVTPAGFCTAWLETEAAFQVPKAAMKEYCFVAYTSFNALRDLRELKTCSAMHQNVTLVLASLPYSTSSE